jgi:hypothetical protein
MRMRNGLVRILVLTSLFAVAGCTESGLRFKGGEAFMSTTTPVDYKANREKPTAWQGDPYAFGGSANASGGLKTGTSYGAGARSDAPERLNPAYDQPQKGSGQNPGEYTNQGAPGHGVTNAPSLQPQPESVNNPSSRR